MNLVETPPAMTEADHQDAEHFRSAAENASRDADELIAKLATAGLTLSVAMTGLAEAGSVTGLRWAAAGFGLAVIVAVANQRLGAETLRTLYERTYELGSASAALDSLAKRFLVLKALNWIAVVAIVAGFAVATTLTFHLEIPGG